MSEIRVVPTVEKAEGEMLTLPQLDLPLTHRFAPGVYMREISMPAGSFVIGHEHRTEHLNVILSGTVLVSLDGVVGQIVGPCTFVSKPGVRKVLFNLTDVLWATIHPTHETDIDRLEALLIVKSPTFVRHLEDLNRLKALTSGGELCPSQQLQ